jgi:DNA repair exonuclease SbcCD nuclease subunit
VCGAASSHAGLILAGDLFVRAQQPDMPANLRELITATQSIPDIICAVGNHDKTGSPSGLENPEWVESVMDRKVEYRNPATGESLSIGANWRHREDEIHEVAGVRFVILHHTYDAELLRNKLMRLGMARFDVLVMHQGLVETIAIEGEYETTTEEIDGFLADTGVKAVVVGHIHKPMTWRSGRGVLFVSPGAIYRCSLAATEDAGHYGVLTVDDAAAGYESVEIRNQRRRETLDPLPADPARLEEYLEFIRGMAFNARSSSLPEEIRRPLVSFKYVVMPGVAPMVEAAAGDMVCCDITPIHTAVYRYMQEEPDERAVQAGGSDYADFEEAARKYAGGKALEVIMAVYRGEDPEIAVNEQLELITKA